MPVTTPPALSAIPAFPALSERAAGTYNANAYACLNHWAATGGPQLAALAANVFANATDAAGSATAAGSAKDDAEAAATAAGGSALLSYNWAVKVDGPVSGGEYSARYWAVQAAAVVATIPTGTINDGTTSGTSVWSSSKVSTELSGKASTADITNERSATATLTNKTISGADNTITADGTNAVGFRAVPQNSQSTAYTCVLSDSGKHILHPSADTTARTFTIPANSSVAYPIGTAITFVNQASAGVVTIAITTDTMRLAGQGTTGSRTLAANGVATAIKLTATEWIISGTGLT